MPPASPTMASGSAKKGKGKEEADGGVTSGVYMFPNGDKFEGESAKSADAVLERSGNGTHTTADGIVYTGKWANDKMNGEGRLEFPSGAVYEGTFVNNQFHGKGRYTWPNGSCYEGEFIENRMEGEGHFLDTEGQNWMGTFRYKAAPGLRFKLGV